MLRIRLDWQKLLGFDQAPASKTNEPTGAASGGELRLARVGARVGRKESRPAQGIAPCIGAKVGGKDA